MVTISAWTDEAASSSFMRKGAHAEAMKHFFDGSLSTSGYTGVWSPVRINSYWVRCEACAKMHDTAQSGPTCSCGAELPTHPSYW